MNWELPSRDNRLTMDLEGYIYHAPALVFIGFNLVWWGLGVYDSLR